jgi:UDP-2-acetamido-3-amino-2,3-dideoxy-glucuronate N-acetyltransferase
MGKLETVRGVRIHNTAEVSDKSEIGEGTFIWNNAQVRDLAKIGKNCIIGKDVYVDTEVSIGDNVKVQNGVSLYRGVKIENDVFLGPHMTFTNDMFPRAFNHDWIISPTLVRIGASIGAHATIVCGTIINSYAMVGAGSVVTKDVPEHSLVFGNPATIRGFVCKCGKKLDIKEKLLDFVIMACSNCIEDVKIPNETFNQIKIK